MTKLTIFAQVRELQWLPALGFCCTMLERQMANYDLFCEVEAIDDGGQMRKALDQLWLGYDAHLVRKPFKTNLGLLRDKVEAVSPDATDFDNFGVIPAIDFSMALVAAISLMAKEDEAGAVVVSKLSQGSVESVILATEGDVTNEQIKNHALMQREIAFQTDLLASLNRGSSQLPSREALITLAQDDGATNIGIEFGE